MDLSEKVLGSSVARELSARRSKTILKIGSDELTRSDLAAVECFNFTAAQSVSEILNKHLNVKNLRDVYDNVNPAHLALPRLGAISLAVLGAAFEAMGIGGAQPLENYVRKHMNGAGIVTFSALKAREQKDEREERARTRARKRNRRDKAHHIRVGRFQQRAANA